MIRIALAAAALPIRAGLSALLADDPAFYLAAEVEQIPDLDQADDIDVVVAAGDRSLMDSDDALDVFEAAPGSSPALLLLLDDEALPDWLLQLEDLAWGALPLNSSVEAIQSAITGVAAGLIVVAPVFAGQLQKTLVSDPSAEQALIQPLTDRELEVLALVARGMPNKKIAASLYISEHTVKFHVSSIYNKLGVANRTEAVRVGVRNGLILL